MINMKMRMISDFILHHSNFHELHEASRVALEATVRMVVDVAQSFNRRALKINVKLLPPRCSHLVRAAQHLLDIPDNVLFEGSETSLSEIRTTLTCLDKRWRMTGRHMCHN